MQGCNGAKSERRGSKQRKACHARLAPMHGNDWWCYEEVVVVVVEITISWEERDESRRSGIMSSVISPPRLASRPDSQAVARFVTLTGCKEAEWT